MSYLNTLKQHIAPIISDNNASFSLLRTMYGADADIFVQYDDKLLTRTGKIREFLELDNYVLASQRCQHTDLFYKLGCIREVSTGLRGELLSKYPQHSVVWGMSPSSVVVLGLNLSSNFNNSLGLVLDISLPPHLSLGAISGMM